eukprot:1158828-Pelagomonas_calceolata.AAC.8
MHDVGIPVVHLVDIPAIGSGVQVWITHLNVLQMRQPVKPSSSLQANICSIPRCPAYTFLYFDWDTKEGGSPECPPTDAAAHEAHLVPVGKHLSVKILNTLHKSTFTLHWSNVHLALHSLKSGSGIGFGLDFWQLHSLKENKRSVHNAT